MSKFTPKETSIDIINDGNRYGNGDSIRPDELNAIIENLFYFLNKTKSKAELNDSSQAIIAEKMKAETFVGDKIQVDDVDTFTLYLDTDDTYKAYIKFDSGSYVFETTKGVGSLILPVPSDNNDYNIATEEWVEDKLSNIKGIEFSIVSSLPTVGETNKIYLLKNDKEENDNLYTEYIYVNNKWEIFGSTHIDTSDFLLKSSTDKQTIKGEITFEKGVEASSVKAEYFEATSNYISFTGSNKTSYITQKGYTLTFPDKTGTFAMTSDIPTSLPASDVYAWAKASSKPSYSYSELSDKPTIPTNNNQLTNGAGYITGINKNMVTTALGFAPYNSTNPNGYTTNKGTVTSISIKMNGATKGTITSSGTIDLGTIITSHQDISGKLDKSGGTMTGELEVLKVENDSDEGTYPSIYAEDGYVSIGDVFGTNSGFTTITNDCKMLYNLYVEESVEASSIIASDNMSVNGKDVATEEWVGKQGFLTSHQDISGKLNKAGDTFTGVFTGAVDGKGIVFKSTDTTNYYARGVYILDNIGDTSTLVLGTNDKTDFLALTHNGVNNIYNIDVKKDNGTVKSIQIPYNSGTLALTSDIPSKLPASDVYSWAKASTKPSYSWDEITSKPTTFTPAEHTHSYLSTSGGNLYGQLRMNGNGIDDVAYIEGVTQEVNDSIGNLDSVVFDSNIYTEYGIYASHYYKDDGTEIGNGGTSVNLLKSGSGSISVSTSQQSIISKSGLGITNTNNLLVTVQLRVYSTGTQSADMYVALVPNKSTTSTSYYLGSTSISASSTSASMMQMSTNSRYSLKTLTFLVIGGTDFTVYCKGSTTLTGYYNYIVQTV